jgi:hypothetical protein
MPKISVLAAAYNAEKTILETYILLKKYTLFLINMAIKEMIFTGLHSLNQVSQKTIFCNSCREQ